ncbi:hypothetical protein LSUB1_G005154 [Lachnellula subtilissima]|uniref:NADH dehydrogenase [ubiquinone] 1 alpha subcomplex subunit 1 n=1 Tax=Lachnellula subtilissima TaxID=602034 RepID=A0A8H8RIG9_9HELO|nr:hypothetical protein LSUB1_G005154 [Lachnellula subtilissima]
MGVPFEALLPYAIMLGMFGFTGAGLSKLRHMQNGGKRARHSVDQWDRVSIPANPPTLLHTLFSGWSHDVDEYTVMDRDRRLTGFLRGQTDNPTAPPGFELNNPWRVGFPTQIELLLEKITDLLLAVGEALLLEDGASWNCTYDSVRNTGNRI